MSEIKKSLYKIRFRTEESIYELYASNVYSSDLMGFIVVDGITFKEFSSDIIANPVEERLRDEFSDSEKVYIPMHSVLRIDQVRTRGTVKILPLDSRKLPVHNNQQ